MEASPSGDKQQVPIMFLQNGHTESEYKTLRLQLTTERETCESQCSRAAEGQVGPFNPRHDVLSTFRSARLSEQNALHDDDQQIILHVQAGRQKKPHSS